MRPRTDKTENFGKIPPGYIIYINIKTKYSQIRIQMKSPEIQLDLGSETLSEGLKFATNCHPSSIIHGSTIPLLLLWLSLHE